MVTAYEGIVAGEAMHQKAIWCIAVELHAQAAINRAMARSWRQHLAAFHFAAERLGQCLQICQHAYVWVACGKVGGRRCCGDPQSLIKTGSNRRTRP